MSKREPTIYIAGPMRGVEEYNYPAFDRQAAALEKQGWQVINPAEMDRDDEKPINGPHEFDPDNNYEDRLGNESWRKVRMAFGKGVGTRNLL